MRRWRRRRRDTLAGCSSSDKAETYIIGGSGITYQWSRSKHRASTLVKVDSPRRDQVIITVNL